MLCAGVHLHNSCRTSGWGFREFRARKFSAIFTTNLNCSLRPSCTGKNSLPLALGSRLGREHPRTQFRRRHGGVEKRGGRKTSRMTPLPKRGLGPPRTVRFPPPAGVSALFFLYKNPRQSRPEALLEGSKTFRESAFSATFSSPHTFCPPPISRPNQ